MIRKACFILIGLAVALTTSASHIVGGYITYTCSNAANNTYLVELYMFWDCGGNFPLPQDEDVRVYDAANNLVSTYTANKTSETYVPPTTTDPCLTPPSWVCVWQGYYEVTITLNPSAGGYTLASQICCRNNTIDNIVNPGVQGSTFVAKVPDPGVSGCNSGPTFATYPPIAICNLDTLKWNHSATDPNGDSLSYYLCDAKDAPFGGPPTPPPFASVPYLAPYTAADPMPANPKIAIDPVTGYLTAFPNQTGTYVVTICIDEWRGGVKIGEYRREVQFNVVSCVMNVNPQVGGTTDTTGTTADTLSACESLTVNFSNASTGAPFFWWDFGTGNLGDTSIALEPTFTYPDTGTYIVTLIANPGYSCADTAYATVLVYPTFTGGFTWNMPACTGSPIQFTDTTSATIGTVVAHEWSFPGGTPPTSTAQNPSVTFSTSGWKDVQLVVTGSFGCIDTVKTTIPVYPPPNLGLPPDITLCTGTDTQIVATGSGTWQWSPGATLSCTNCKDPIAAPTSNTVYTVTLTSNQGCQSVDSIAVSLADYPVVSAGSDVLLCNSGSTQLNATATDTSGAVSWKWNPTTWLSNSTTPNPFANPYPGSSGTITYCVTATNVHGCAATDCVDVQRNAISVYAGLDQNYCAGGSAQLNASSPTPNITWEWLPNQNLTPSNTVSNPVADPTITTQYTVTVTDVDGCTASDTMNLNVLPLPPIDAGTNTSVCLGFSTLLSAVGAGSYQWSPGATLSCTNCQSPTATPAVTTTYYVTGTGANGCTNVDSVTVFVTTEPLVTISADTYVCDGGSTQLNSTGPFGSTFAWTPSAGLSDPSIADPVASPTATTTYSLRVTDPSGCFKDTTVTITVRPLPTVGSSANADICVGDNITLTATGAGAGGSYLWMPGSLAGTPVNVAPIVTTVYTVTATDSWGCQNTATTTITVNPLPTISAGADQSVCSGMTATLTASGGVSYSWQPGGSTANPLNVTPGSTTTYVVTGTDANGCTGTDDVTITVDTLPVVTAATADPDICAGASATLTASGGSTYVWMPGSIPGGTVVVTPAASILYTVTGTDGNGCVGTATVAVTVHQLPNINAGADQDICENASTSLNATGVGAGGSYVWQPGGAVTAGITVAPLTTTTYTVTGTDSWGCVGTDQVTVTVHPPPPIDAGPNTSVCIGSTVTLTATGGSTYLWMPGALPGAGITVSPVANTMYTVTGTDAFGCSNVDSVLVTVNQPPIVGATTNTPDICPGASATLTASGAATYSWQPGGLTGSPVVVTPSSSVTYTVTGTDANGCLDTATVHLNLLPLPSVNAGTDVAICEGESTQLSATGALSYTWTPVAGLDDPNVSNPVAAPAATTIYQVTGVDANGCANTDLVTVTVNPLPVITASPDLFIYEGNCVSILGSGGVSYSWSPPQTLNNPVIASPQACPGETTTYYVTGYDANGCSNIDSVTITVIGIPMAEIPSAFTPNGDGLNDQFGVILHQDFELVRLQVYSRWGDLVHDTDNINDFWDGTFDDQDLPIDTYVYVVIGRDQGGVVSQWQGNVTLIR